MYGNSDKERRCWMYNRKVLLNTELFAVIKHWGGGGEPRPGVGRNGGAVH